ncbi:hypothetical protein HK102_006520 [Quaeritorhiza haematococci]|nr:hypothetical protein HK102_006520 [Quaeritorhiza haematococci]
MDLNKQTPLSMPGVNFASDSHHLSNTILPPPPQTNLLRDLDDFLDFPDLSSPTSPDDIVRALTILKSDDDVLDALQLFITDESQLSRMFYELSAERKQLVNEMTVCCDQVVVQEESSSVEKLEEQKPETQPLSTRAERHSSEDSTGFESLRILEITRDATDVFVRFGGNHAPNTTSCLEVSFADITINPEQEAPGHGKSLVLTAAISVDASNNKPEVPNAGNSSTVRRPLLQDIVPTTTTMDEKAGAPEAAEKHVHKQSESLLTADDLSGVVNRDSPTVTSPLPNAAPTRTVENARVPESPKSIDDDQGGSCAAAEYSFSVVKKDDPSTVCHRLLQDIVPTATTVDEKVDTAKDAVKHCRKGNECLVTADDDSGVLRKEDSPTVTSPPLSNTAPTTTIKIAGVPESPMKHRGSPGESFAAAGSSSSMMKTEPRNKDSNSPAATGFVSGVRNEGAPNIAGGVKPSYTQHDGMDDSTKGESLNIVRTSCADLDTRPRATGKLLRENQAGTNTIAAKSIRTTDTRPKTHFDAEITADNSDERIRKLTGQLAMLTASLSDKEETIFFLETESRIHREENANLLAERKKIKYQLRDTETCAAEQLRSVRTKNNELSELRGKLETAEPATRERLDCERMSDERIRKMTGQLAMLTASLSDKEETIFFLETESRIHREENARLLAEREKMKHQVREMETCAAQQLDSFRTKREKLSELTKKLETAEIAANESLDREALMLEQLRISGMEILQYRETIDFLEVENGALKKTNEDYISRMKKLESQQLDCEKQLIENTREFDDSVAAKDEEILELKRKLESATVPAKDAVERESQLLKEVDDFGRIVKNDHKTIEPSVEKKTNEDLVTRCQKLENEKREMKKNHNSLEGSEVVHHRSGMKMDQLNDLNGSVADDVMALQPRILNGEAKPEMASEDQETALKERDEDVCQPGCIAGNSKSQGESMLAVMEEKPMAVAPPPEVQSACAKEDDKGHSVVEAGQGTSDPGKSRAKQPEPKAAARLFSLSMRHALLTEGEPRQLGHRAHRKEMKDETLSHRIGIESDNPNNASASGAGSGASCVTVGPVGTLSPGAPKDTNDCKGEPPPHATRITSIADNELVQPLPTVTENHSTAQIVSAESVKLFVGNISAQCTIDDLKAFFSGVNEHIETTYFGGRNYAFVTMDSRAAAETALKKHGSLGPHGKPPCPRNPPNAERSAPPAVVWARLTSVSAPCQQQQQSRARIVAAAGPSQPARTRTNHPAQNSRQVVPSGSPRAAPTIRQARPFPPRSFEGAVTGANANAESRNRSSNYSYHSHASSSSSRGRQYTSNYHSNIRANGSSRSGNSDPSWGAGR